MTTEFKIELPSIIAECAWILLPGLSRKHFKPNIPLLVLVSQKQAVHSTEGGGTLENINNNNKTQVNHYLTTQMQVHFHGLWVFGTGDLSGMWSSVPLL